MSVKLKFEKGTLSINVTVKDEALPKLMAIAAEHYCEPDPASAAASIFEATSSPLAVPTYQSAAQPGAQFQPNRDRIVMVKEWLRSHAASEALSALRCKMHQDRILALGAHHEAVAETASWKPRALKQKYAEARESLPGNLGRDMAIAVKDGVLGIAPDRGYMVGRQGWEQLYEKVLQLTSL